MYTRTLFLLYAALAIPFSLHVKGLLYEQSSSFIGVEAKEKFETVDLIDLDGNRIDFQEIQRNSRATLVFFWATW